MSMETYGNDTDQHVQADIFDTDSNLDKARNSKQTTACLCAYPIRQKRRLLAVLLCTIGSALFAILAPKVCGIAIIGPTGAGKTTPVNLLMRFYDIQSGHITIDGTDITAMRRNGVRSLMGMVLQDTWLFGGTIRENISYGRGHATDTEIQAAAKAARADHFIRTLPQGYDTVLNEETTSLSQGQRHASNASWHAVPEHRRDRIRGFATPDCKAPYSTVFYYGFRPLFRPRSPRGPARPTGCGMRPADPHAGRCGRRNSHAGPESGRLADAWNAGRRSTRATKRTPGSAGR